MRIRKKLRRAKRLTYLALLVGAVLAVRRAQAARRARTKLGPPASWPPLRPAEEPVAAAGDLATETPVTEPPATRPDPTPAWVAPVDGACPVSHPVKVNTGSGIFHQPGGRFYDRTTPHRCYVDAAAAEADGYRAAKGS